MILPEWPAPDNVTAVITTRIDGNLAAQQNRQHLQVDLQLQQPPCWLQQVHGTDVIEAVMNGSDDMPQADGSYGKQHSLPCVVLTADCLPLLICNQQGTWVQAVHVGWRGLAAGIIEKAVTCYSRVHGGKSCDLLAYLGPAISKQYFEVGEDVLQASIDGFSLERQQTLTDIGFVPSEQKKQKYFCDLYAIARQRLAWLGVDACFGGEYCTYSDEAGGSERFFSYRRDGEQSGRMASLIWLNSH